MARGLATVEGMNSEAWAVLGTIANLVLAGVTVVYVVLTGWMAKQSKTAAEAASRAANSAAETAGLQRVAIDAQVSVMQPWFKTAGGGADFHAMDIQLRPLDGAYFLRSVELIDMVFASDQPGEQPQTVQVGQQLTPAGERTLPTIVDETDGVMFAFDAATRGDAVFGHNDWHVYSWRLLVTISISQSSESTRRVIVTSGLSSPPSRKG